MTRSSTSIFFLNRDIIYWQLNLEGVKIHYVDVRKTMIWCEPLEEICGSFYWEKWRDIIYEDLPSETKKMFWNFSCSFDIPQSPKHKKKIQIPVFLDSIFFPHPNRRRKFSFSFLTRDQQVVFIKWIFGFLFEHQFNRVQWKLFFCEKCFFWNLWKMKIVGIMWVELKF